MSRGVAFAKDRETAAAEAQAAAESSYRMYSTWNMQEDTMVRINIESDSRVDDWAVAGNADDCLEQFDRMTGQGVGYVGITFYNLPAALEARQGVPRPLRGRRHPEGALAPCNRSSTSAPPPSPKRQPSSPSMGRTRWCSEAAAPRS